MYSTSSEHLMKSAQHVERTSWIIKNYPVNSSLPSCNSSRAFLPTPHTFKQARLSLYKRRIFEPLNRGMLDMSVNVNVAVSYMRGVS